MGVETRRTQYNKAKVRTFCMPSPEGVRGEFNQNVIMKKIFMYAMIAFVGVALMSCSKGKNNADDLQTKTKGYLQLSDLTPLHLIPLSQAEANLKEMGYSGGYSNKEDGYIYYSADKKETIVFGLNSEEQTEDVIYMASKGIAPEDAKDWLSHMSEKVTLPKYKRFIPFAGAYYYNSVEEDPKMEDDPIHVAKTYQQYISLLENLASGMRVEVFWEEDDIPENESVGYSVAIIYRYGNNIDQATLSIASLHRVEPNLPE